MTISKCQTYSRPILVGVVLNQPVRYLYQPDCKTWGCPYCGRKNMLSWAAKIRDGIEYYQRSGFADWSMITFTMSRYTRGFDKSLDEWPSRWAKISTRIRRLIPGVRYMLIPEQHKDGTLHTHSLFSGKISNTWISKNCHTCGLGYMSKSKPMYSAYGAGKYVTKYLTKSLSTTAWPKGLRRIRTSQRWPEVVDEDNHTLLEAEWKYIATYPDAGLDYLAVVLTEETGIMHKIV